MVLAVLLTCYNRKDTTVNCIKKLLPQLEKLDCNYKIYVCDDRSTDGSFEALKEMLPNQTIVQSTGNLYWNKGMRMVMNLATADACDYYLMVNDDVDFCEDALEIMFSGYRRAGRSCGVVGGTVSKRNGRMTYGGRNCQDDQEPIRPTKELQTCVYTNWNCFLIDKDVVEQVGYIDGKYQHGFGDYDYSLRMKKKDIPVYVACGIVGYCERNSSKGTFHDISLSRKQRFKSLFGPKGVPVYSYFRYHLKNEGIKRLPACIYGYGSYIVSIILKRAI